MIKVGIVGSSGYVAGELLRCLIHHPEVEISFLYSHSQPDLKAGEIHQDLMHLDNLSFSNEIDQQADVVFLCLGHGNSKKFLQAHTFSLQTKVIDLSNDFRLNKEATQGDKTFVYGLTECNHEVIKTAQHIANPGCFATAIQLALLPLAAQQQLGNDVHIHAITGSTGAGQGLSAISHFSWRNNNVSIYKPFDHQHLGEIGETIMAAQPTFEHELNFLPVRGNFTRGIFASAYTTSDLSETQLQSIYAAYYQDAPFTYLSKNTVHLKQVVNTNLCYLHVQKIDGKVLITSVIDNLLKGAAGQAIENMNLMFGLDQQCGLALKAALF
jgi:N-acetyl-gamma-glutamyl-phosphate reductase